MSGPNLKMSFKPLTYGHKHGGARDIDQDRRDARAEKPNRRPKSQTVITKSPSNSSTTGNAPGGKSFVEQPQPVPHSQHSAERSKNYSDNVVRATQVNRSKTKATRATHPKTNAGDKSLGWPASKNTTLGSK
jgi:phytoene dehydrogenase-like protein